MKKKYRPMPKVFSIPRNLQKMFLGIFIAIVLSCFAWITEEMISVKLPQSDQPATLYSNQTNDDLEKTFVTAIREAKQSVILVIYSLTNHNIIQSLRQKAEEGVPIFVICDAQASPYIGQKLGPKIQLIKRLGKGLMHLKILLIDDSQVWLGSANMTGESLHMNGNLVVALDHPALAQAIRSKAESLHEYDRSRLFQHQDFLASGQKIELWFLPDDKQASIRIKNLIRSAKKTIRIAMFTWTRLDFAKEVIDAKNRGIDVEVVIDRNAGKGSSVKVVELLKKAGVSIQLSQGTGLLHHKFLYIDQEILENGSANWTRAAFNDNDDCFLIINDLNLNQIEHMNKLWDEIWRDSA